MPVNPDVVAAQDFFLDAMLDAVPAGTVEYGLLSGDPRTGGAELTSAGGYASVPVTDYAAFWNAAAGGEKTTGILPFGDATGEWSGPATHWCVKVDGDVWLFGPLDVDDPLYVTAAGPAPHIRIRTKFASILGG